MWGVIGLVYERARDDLVRIASELLRILEYRGYDSTGAAIQGDTEDVTLAKGVGAPSVMVDELGIRRMGGRAFCGQVRWSYLDRLGIADHGVHPDVPKNVSKSITVD